MKNFSTFSYFCIIKQKIDMSKIHLIKGEFKEKLDLLFAPGVKADVFANAIKHDHKSKNPTTRWSDIIKLK